MVSNWVSVGVPLRTQMVPSSDTATARPGGKLSAEHVVKSPPPEFGKATVSIAALVSKILMPGPINTGGSETDPLLLELLLELLLLELLVLELLVSVEPLLELLLVLVLLVLELLPLLMPGPVLPSPLSMAPPPPPPQAVSPTKQKNKEIIKNNLNCFINALAYKSSLKRQKSLSR
jgi:hypothetical protein